MWAQAGSPGEARGTWPTVDDDDGRMTRRARMRRRAKMAKRLQLRGARPRTGPAMHRLQSDQGTTTTTAGGGERQSRRSGKTTRRKHGLRRSGRSDENDGDSKARATGTKSPSRRRKIRIMVAAREERQTGDETTRPELTGPTSQTISLIGHGKGAEQGRRGMSGSRRMARMAGQLVAASVSSVRESRW